MIGWAAGVLGVIGAALVVTAATGWQVLAGFAVLLVAFVFAVIWAEGLTESAGDMLDFQKRERLP